MLFLKWTPQLLAAQLLMLWSLISLVFATVSLTFPNLTTASFPSATPFGVLASSKANIYNALLIRVYSNASTFSLGGASPGVGNCNFALPLINLPPITPAYSATVAYMTYEVLFAAGCRDLKQATAALVMAWTDEVMAARSLPSLTKGGAVLLSTFCGNSSIKLPFISHDPKEEEEEEEVVGDYILDLRFKSRFIWWPPLPSLIRKEVYSSVGDSPFLLHTVYVPPGEFDRFALFANDKLAPLKVDINSDFGRWNDLFLSTGVSIFLWFIFALNCIIVLISVSAQFFQGDLSQGRLRPNYQSFVFFTTLLSVIICASIIPQDFSTTLSQISIYLADSLFLFSFYIMILFWTNLQANVIETSLRPFFPLRILAIFCFILTILDIVLEVLITRMASYAFASSSLDSKYYKDLSSWIIMGSRVLLILCWLCYMLSFGWNVGNWDGISLKKRQVMAKMNLIISLAVIPVLWLGVKWEVLYFIYFHRLATAHPGIILTFWIISLLLDTFRALLFLPTPWVVQLATIRSSGSYSMEGISWTRTSITEASIDTFSTRTSNRQSSVHDMMRRIVGVSSFPIELEKQSMERSATNPELKTKESGFLTETRKCAT